MTKIILYLFLLISTYCFSQKNSETKEQIKKRQENIINEVNSCKEGISYIFQMSDWQNCIDMGLKKDSTIAYLWQQKAMPYFKIRKYQIGMKYIDRAVNYDKSSWLPYRAFIKTIFSKEYDKAIIDLDECIKLYNNSYVIDHTYTFYKSLCYLQLNNFDKAKKNLEISIQKNLELKIDHHVEYFYMGIIYFELKDYSKAIEFFDKALFIYKEFSDAIAYKAYCKILSGKISMEEFKNEIKVFKDYNKIGHTINEANAIYETYPYQIK